MWNVTLKGMLAHKLRLALTALAIVLGVTFISGTFVLTDTLNNTFSVLFSSVYQHVDFRSAGTRSWAAAARTRSATSCPPRCRPPSAGCPASRPPRGRSRATPSSWPATASRSRRAARRRSA